MTAHRLWIESRISRRTNNAPGAETPGGAELVKHRSGDRAKRGLDTPFSHSRFADARRAVPMSSQASETRARELRARLSTLVEVCRELEVPIPLRKQLAPALGVSERQIARYLSILIDQGVVERRTHKSAGRIAA